MAATFAELGVSWKRPRCKLSLATATVRSEAFYQEVQGMAKLDFGCLIFVSLWEILGKFIA